MGGNMPYTALGNCNCRRDRWPVVDGGNPRVEARLARDVGNAADVGHKLWDWA